MSTLICFTGEPGLRVSEPVATVLELIRSTPTGRTARHQYVQLTAYTDEVPVYVNVDQIIHLREVKP